MENLRLSASTVAFPVSKQSHSDTSWRCNVDLLPGGGFWQGGPERRAFFENSRNRHWQAAYSRITTRDGRTRQCKSLNSLQQCMESITKKSMCEWTEKCEKGRTSEGCSTSKIDEIYICEVRWTRDQREDRGTIMGNRQTSMGSVWSFVNLYSHFYSRVR